LTCLGCGTATLWAAGGWRTLVSGLGAVFAIGLAMAGTQYLVVTRGFWSIGATVAGLVGLAVGVLWVRWRARSGISEQQPPAVNPAQTVSPSWALLPYVLLIATVLAAELLPAVRDFLGQVVLSVQFPELATARGWVTPAEQGRTINAFGHPGALLVYVSAITYATYKWHGCYRPGSACRIAQGVVNRAARSSLGTAAMVGMAVTMQHAGMTYLLADGIARVAGPAFPLVAPFIGALGSFITGSNTNSNVIFGDLQQSVAALVGVSPLIILASQTAGGAIGSAFAPAKIIVGCSTVDAEEGPALQAVMRYGLAMLVVLALVTGVAVLLSRR
jgi:lactate permease